MQIEELQAMSEDQILAHINELELKVVNSLEAASTAAQNVSKDIGDAATTAASAKQTTEATATFATSARGDIEAMATAAKTSRSDVEVIETKADGILKNLDNTVQDVDTLNNVAAAHASATVETIQDKLTEIKEAVANGIVEKVENKVSTELINAGVSAYTKATLAQSSVDTLANNVENLSNKMTSAVSLYQDISDSVAALKAQAAQQNVYTTAANAATNSVSDALTALQDQLQANDVTKNANLIMNAVQIGIGLFDLIRKKSS